MSADIKLIIDHENGEEVSLDVPNDIGLNLMEFLKANDYEQILGTCGGMALCASCHVRVLEANPPLGEQSDDEYGILETLPEVHDNSRLSCQIKLNTDLESIKIQIIGDQDL
jgi:2Fe-2S ferredoxin